MPECSWRAGVARLHARGSPQGDLSTPWRRGRAQEGQLEGRLFLTKPPVALERLRNLKQRERASSVQGISHIRKHTHAANDKHRQKTVALRPSLGGTCQGWGSIPGPGRLEGFGPGRASHAPPWPRGRRPRRSSCPCRRAPGHAAAHSCA